MATDEGLLGGDPFEDLEPLDELDALDELTTDEEPVEELEELEELEEFEELDPLDDPLADPVEAAADVAPLGDAGLGDLDAGLGDLPPASDPLTADLDVGTDDLAATQAFEPTEAMGLDETAAFQPDATAEFQPDATAEFQPTDATAEFSPDATLPAASVPSDPNAAYAAATDAYEDDGEYEDFEEPLIDRSFSLRSFLAGAGACTFSMIVHVIALVALAVMTLGDPTAAAIRTLVSAPPPENIEDPPVEIELNEEIEIVEEDQAVAMFSAAPAVGITGGAAAAVGAPALDQTLVETAEATEVHVDAPTIGMPDSVALVETIPDGDVKGEVRDIVDDYQAALDRIAQELMWMLDQGPVLVVWVFDQSGSMKDDQREIRDRFENVYNQLGIVGTRNSDALLTAVVSYGNGYLDHTNRKPTSNRVEIQKAIDEIPIDETGEEMMCQAVGKAITDYQKLARRGRQMCLVLVTDESGNRENNERFLEPAIAAAKKARCKIYVLGRESVFGYPYAYISWKNPDTNRHHWLRIDRGPETGFPEQLQTNGFRRRHDAFSSGFGPYEQARMARESNGVFFMLPTVETNLVAAVKNKYELEAMRPYRPDLRQRQLVFRDRDKFPMRTMLWKIIQDMNPHNPAAQNMVELQTDGFSLDRAQFVKQAQDNQRKALMHLKYMSMAQATLEKNEKMRTQEVEPRWQGNFDLTLAQLIAYQARTYEYGVALEEFMKAPKQAAPTRPPNLKLVHWDVRTTRKPPRTEEAKPYIAKASELLKRVMEEHAGSPWAARAQWELNRGFGVDVFPDYHAPYVNKPNAMKPPKL